RRRRSRCAAARRVGLRQRPDHVVAQPGTVVVPTNAAAQPAGVLADRGGNLRVTLTKVAAEQPAGDQPAGDQTQEVA
ncbi:MAG: hypothetical protein LC679_08775, partial [Intrasporangiaceae bacterium]|nr:hypothetical protein [Intrasporangiaceae bacterium]